MARRTLPRPYNNEVDLISVNNLISELEELTGLNVVKGERFEINGADSSEIVLVSPNGTKYKIVVDDNGNLSTNAV
jgi:hypothetical protein